MCDKHSKKTLKLNVFAVPDPNGTDSRVCDDCYDKFVAKPVGKQKVKKKSLVLIRSWARSATVASKSSRGRCHTDRTSNCM